jgi:hypothetical protein
MKAERTKIADIKVAKEDVVYWDRHAQAQSTSGVSLSAYCRINDVNYGRMRRFLENSRKATQSNTRVIPVKLKPETCSKVETSSARTLCTLRLPNGAILSVHDQEALCCLLKEMK